MLLLSLRKEKTLTDFQELDTLVSILRHPAGYVVEINGLYVARQRNGEYHVCHCSQEGKTEWPCADVWEAAKLFMRKRKVLLLGYDLETPLGSECFLG